MILVATLCLGKVNVYSVFLQIYLNKFGQFGRILTKVTRSLCVRVLMSKLIHAKQLIVDYSYLSSSLDHSIFSPLKNIRTGT